MWPRRGALAAVIGIAVYTLLVGADASVVRAALTGSLALFARQFGRRQTAVNTLAFSGALMCLINPGTLWDVGFQLSFMATLGLILYAEPLSRWFTGLAALRLPLSTAQRLSQPAGEYFLFTLAAQLTTLVLILYYFQRFSLVSFLANPLVLPAQPAVMILGGLAALTGMVFQPLGQLFAYLTWPFIVYTIQLVELFARGLRGHVLVRHRGRGLPAAHPDPGRVLGRLIRHRRDSGVLAILDPRIRTMSYGRRFLASLPPAPVSAYPADIDRFFAADSPSR